MDKQNIIYRNRNRLQLTQEKLAEKINVSVATIKRWEKGELPRSPVHAEKMGELFGDDNFVDKLYQGK